MIIRTNKSSSFTLQFVEVQRQSRGGDCTLFAVANAVALYNGQDPHLVRYDQTQMRKHPCDCYEEGNLYLSQRERSPGECKVAFFKHKRSYSLLYVQVASQYGKMIQCHTCKDWFHNDCKPDIPKAFWLTTEKWR